MSVSVGIVGVTGPVGQTFAKLLNNHPDFRVVKIAAASADSAGKKFGDESVWRVGGPAPAFLTDLTFVDHKPESFKDCKAVFSALSSPTTFEVESAFAAAGLPVFTNADVHRFDADVPVMFPAVNPDHLQMIKAQPSFKSKGGFIVTNGNCTATGLSVGLKPLEDVFGVERVCVSTMQCIHGGGFPGLHAPDIHDNVVPYIGGEEDKMETEPLKILGAVTENLTVTNNPMRITALCNRVPVLEGHTMSMTVKVKNLCGATDNTQLVEKVKDAYRNYQPKPEVAKLPHCPHPVVQLFTSNDRPQPRLDKDLGGGMVTSVGRVRPSTVLGEVKLVLVCHNGVSSTAGASVFNAELALHHKYIKA